MEITMQDQDQPSSHTYTFKDQFDEKDELLNATGINIWSATQETLENQALNELNEFAKQTSTALEDGEVEDSTEENISEQSKEVLILENYIKKQEEFKRQKSEKRLHNKLDSSVGESGKFEQCNKRKKETRKTKAIRRKSQCISISEEEHTQPHSSSGSEYIPSDEGSEYECSNISAHSSVNKAKRKSQLRGLEKLEMMD
ncbi:hypothetical protein HHI36_003227 [Cryptolaemus montrouzieri]|uniref:Uncharacterized protein n=1 Tax=Cryptolaemus montrouzieri TaxID=559131 RepID=A0ABD2PCV0_9CUCU